jgi:hypothetical protein
MDAQEFRSIQEAYMEVVENQQLNEGKVELDQERRSRIGRQIGKRVRNAASDISASGSGFMSKGIRDKLKTSAAKKVEGAKKMMGALKSAQKEEADLYDIILSHLLDEGYAETPEAAQVIMVNMSEEWRESIVEETKRTEYLQKKFNKENERKSGSALKHISGKQNTGQALQKARESERHMRGER